MTENDQSPLQMNLDRVESWRNSVENGIRDFLSDLPSHVSKRLDFSLDSLPILEEWIIATFPPSELIHDPSQVFIPDGLMYYIGETFRKNLGGYWNVHFAKLEPDYPYGEYPVIEGFFRVRGVAVCPWILIGFTLEKRSGQYLHEVLNFYIRLYKPKS